MKKCFTYSGFLSLALIVLFAPGISGCYYDKEQLLYPGLGNCDTAAVKYSTTITRILNASCNSCHGGNFSPAGVKLGTYADTRVQALNGRLYGSISHSSGYEPMPLYAPMLSECNIQAIKKWIDDGAPNN